jgi:hypothetical protein
MVAAKTPMTAIATTSSVHDNGSIDTFGSIVQTFFRNNQKFNTNKTRTNFANERIPLFASIDLDGLISEHRTL